ncbi:hypothetical protein PYW07_017327 [Mythimna separata]|uniref:RING-type domain-containing protein n=1 Tax=Mythimna separata TaxID=271217 RepID=A0AAD7YXJ5_MYTSE|nr:hypothetical protein PYW07_017327 [Mythimna separata]
MSQWNNTYTYNNQYQAWNGDPNVQYVNQAYYPNRPEQSNQYVSFNEFLSQMQNSGAPSASNYSNVQYENYPARQYSYQNVPSTTQNPQLESYGYAATTGNVSSGTEAYPMNVQSQFNPVAPTPNVYTNAMILKSNLTPTATEFVPKGSMMTTSTSAQNIPDSSAVHDDSESRNNYSNINEPRNHYSNMNDSRNNYPSVNEPRNTSGSSSDTNWRERSQPSQQSTETSQKPDSYQHGDVDTRVEHPKKQESNGRHRDNNYRNNDSNGRHHDSNNRNQDSNNRNQETDSRQYESSNRQHDSSSRNYESNNRNYDSNNKRGQGKGNFKSKNKDDARTFYNSAISKDSQDVRNGRGETSGRGKNWVGTPRLRAMERNSTEDEQYANTYLQAREEKSERDNNRETDNRDRDTDRGRDTRDKHRDSRDTYERDRDYRDVRETERDNRDYRERDRGNRDTREKDRDSRDIRERGRDYRDVRERDRDNRDVRERDRDYRDNRDRDRDNRDTREMDRDYRDVRDTDRDNRDIRERDRGNRDIRERDRDTRERERAIKSENIPSPARTKTKYGNDQVNKEMTQRERLTEQLDKGTLECLVCCDRVKQFDQVWSCCNCYHVLHLRCIRKWAMSSMVEGKWRCPACQNTNEAIPTEYRCMCGAVRAPEYQRGSTGAHTCGRACRRARACPHPCTLLCHPGPCPPCQATVVKHCGCGAETRSILCSSKLPQVCGRVCGRTLLCGVHNCAKECHEGPCDICAETVEQVCHCPAAKSRSVACTLETGACTSWSCGDTCGRVLACGAHVCRAHCHAPPCQPCQQLPQYVHACPCGNTKLAKDSRKACTDPIPLCGNICAKPLPCGPAGDKHFCKLNCHEGPCPECPDKTVLQCRCGHSSREVPCADLPEMYNNVLCQKKCNKKLSCGRHRCRTVCCAATSHRCAVVCGRTLSCQTHRCEEFCHTGHCAPCPRVSEYTTCLYCRTDVTAAARCAARRRRTAAPWCAAARCPARRTAARSSVTPATARPARASVSTQLVYTVVRTSPLPHGVLRGDVAPLRRGVRPHAVLPDAPLRGVLSHRPLRALPARQRTAARSSVTPATARPARASVSTQLVYTVVRTSPLPHGVLRGDVAPLRRGVRPHAVLPDAPLRGVLSHRPLRALPARQRTAARSSVTPATARPARASVSTQLVYTVVRTSPLPHGVLRGDVAPLRRGVRPHAVLPDAPLRGVLSHRPLRALPARQRTAARSSVTPATARPARASVSTQLVYTVVRTSPLPHGVLRGDVAPLRRGVRPHAVLPDAPLRGVLSHRPLRALPARQRTAARSSVTPATARPARASVSTQLVYTVVRTSPLPHGVLRGDVAPLRRGVRPHAVLPDAPLRGVLSHRPLRALPARQRTAARSSVTPATARPARASVSTQLVYTVVRTSPLPHGVLRGDVAPLRRGVRPHAVLPDAPLRGVLSHRPLRALPARQRTAARSSVTPATARPARASVSTQLVYTVVRTSPLPHGVLRGDVAPLRRGVRPHAVLPDAPLRGVLSHRPLRALPARQRTAARSSVTPATARPARASVSTQLVYTVVRTSPLPHGVLRGDVAPLRRGVRPHAVLPDAPLRGVLSHRPLRALPARQRTAARSSVTPATARPARASVSTQLVYTVVRTSPLPHGVLRGDVAPLRRGVRPHAVLPDAPLRGVLSHRPLRALPARQRTAARSSVTPATARPARASVSTQLVYTVVRTSPLPHGVLRGDVAPLRRGVRPHAVLPDAPLRGVLSHRPLRALPARQRTAARSSVTPATARPARASVSTQLVYTVVRTSPLPHGVLRGDVAPLRRGVRPHAVLPDAPLRGVLSHRPLRALPARQRTAARSSVTPATARPARASVSTQLVYTVVRTSPLPHGVLRGDVAPLRRGVRPHAVLPDAPLRGVLSHRPLRALPARQRTAARSSVTPATARPARASVSTQLVYTVVRTSPLPHGVLRGDVAPLRRGVRPHAVLPDAPLRGVLSHRPLRALPARQRTAARSSVTPATARPARASVSTQLVYTVVRTSPLPHGVLRGDVAPLRRGVRPHAVLPDAPLRGVLSHRPLRALPARQRTAARSSVTPATARPARASVSTQLVYTVVRTSPLPHGVLRGDVAPLRRGVRPHAVLPDAPLRGVLSHRPLRALPARQRTAARSSVTPATARPARASVSTQLVYTVVRTSPLPHGVLRGDVAPLRRGVRPHAVLPDAPLRGVLSHRPLRALPARQRTAARSSVTPATARPARASVSTQLVYTVVRTSPLPHGVLRGDVAPLRRGVRPHAVLPDAPLRGVLSHRPLRALPARQRTAARSSVTPATARPARASVSTQLVYTVVRTSPLPHGVLRGDVAPLRRGVRPHAVLPDAPLRGVLSHRPLRALPARQRTAARSSVTPATARPARASVSTQLVYTVVRTSPLPHGVLRGDVAPLRRGVRPHAVLPDAPLRGVLSHRPLRALPARQRTAARSSVTPATARPARASVSTQLVYTVVRTSPLPHGVLRGDVAPLRRGVRPHAVLPDAPLRGVLSHRPLRALPARQRTAARSSVTPATARPARASVSTQLVYTVVRTSPLPHGVLRGDVAPLRRGVRPHAVLPDAPLRGVLSHRPLRALPARQRTAARSSVTPATARPARASVSTQLVYTVVRTSPLPHGVLRGDVAPLRRGVRPHAVLPDAPLRGVLSHRPLRALPARQRTAARSSVTPATARPARASVSTQLVYTVVRTSPLPHGVLRGDVAPLRRGVRPHAVLPDAPLRGVLSHRPLRALPARQRTAARSSVTPATARPARASVSTQLVYTVVRTSPLPHGVLRGDVAPLRRGVRPHAVLPDAPLRGVLSHRPLRALPARQRTAARSSVTPATARPARASVSTQLVYTVVRTSPLPHGVLRGDVAPLRRGVRPHAVLPDAPLRGVLSHRPLRALPARQRTAARSSVTPATARPARASVSTQLVYTVVRTSPLPHGVLRGDVAPLRRGVRPHAVLPDAPLRGVLSHRPLRALPARQRTAARSSVTPATARPARASVSTQLVYTVVRTSPLPHGVLRGDVAPLRRGVRPHAVLPDAPLRGVLSHRPLRALPARQRTAARSSVTPATARPARASVSTQLVYTVVRTSPLPHGVLRGDVAPLRRGVRPHAVLPDAPLRGVLSHRPLRALPARQRTAARSSVTPATARPARASVSTQLVYTVVRTSPLPHGVLRGDVAPLRRGVRPHAVLPDAPLRGVLSHRPLRALPARQRTAARSSVTPATARPARASVSTQLVYTVVRTSPLPHGVLRGDVAPLRRGVRPHAVLPDAPLRGVLSHRPLRALPARQRTAARSSVTPATARPARASVSTQLVYTVVRTSPLPHGVLRGDVAPLRRGVRPHAVLPDAPLRGVLSHRPLRALPARQRTAARSSVTPATARPARASVSTQLVYTVVRTSPLPHGVLRGDVAPLRRGVRPHAVLPDAPLRGVLSHRPLRALPARQRTAARSSVTPATARPARASVSTQLVYTVVRTSPLPHGVLRGDVAPLRRGVRPHAVLPDAPLRGVLSHRPLRALPARQRTAARSSVTPATARPARASVSTQLVYTVVRTSPLPHGVLRGDVAPLRRGVRPHAVLPDAPLRGVLSHRPLRALPARQRTAARSSVTPATARPARASVSTQLVYTVVRTSPLPHGVLRGDVAPLRRGVRPHAVLPDAPLRGVLSHRPLRALPARQRTAARSSVTPATARPARASVSTQLVYTVVRTSPLPHGVLRGDVAPLRRGVRPHAVLPDAPLRGVLSHRPLRALPARQRTAARSSVTPATARPARASVSTQLVYTVVRTSPLPHGVLRGDVAPLRRGVRPHAVLPDAPLRGVLSHRPLRALPARQRTAARSSVTPATARPARASVSTQLVYTVVRTSPLPHGVLRGDVAPLRRGVRPHAVLPDAPLRGVLSHRPLRALPARQRTAARSSVTPATARPARASVSTQLVYTVVRTSPLPHGVLRGDVAPLRRGVRPHAVLPDAPLRGVLSHRPLRALPARFDELTCECGAEVILPPVRCGARPPACSAPCIRQRPCKHPPHHSCHSGDCPPCVVLTTKRCHGDHEVSDPASRLQRALHQTETLQAPAAPLLSLWRLAPCIRQRPCKHPPHHSCHSGDCPPCVVLTTKRCHGDHEVSDPASRLQRALHQTETLQAPAAPLLSLWRLAPCIRQRPCKHPPHHSCHSGDCPPCVVLTTKRCHGDHEVSDPASRLQRALHQTETLQAPAAPLLSLWRLAPCIRQRPCKHPPHHSCHSGDCPPCVVLTTKRCHGDHEVSDPASRLQRALHQTETLQAPAAPLLSLWRLAPCIRQRPCKHPPHHSCHSGDCPPCVVLTTKRCHGDHEVSDPASRLQRALHQTETLQAPAAPLLSLWRLSALCSADYQALSWRPREEFSCGLPCGKPLPCGKHTCIKTCHKGPCDTGKCTQPCMEKRPSCGHPCAAACHVGAEGAGAACPSSAACRRSVRATCPCGRRHADRPCSDNARDYAK